MSVKMTVLQSEERFATMREGQVMFWEVRPDGEVVLVPEDEALLADGDWTLHTDLPSVPYLRVVFAGEADHSNYQHFWVGSSVKGIEPVGTITTHPDTAKWLTDHFGYNSPLNSNRPKK